MSERTLARSFSRGRAPFEPCPLVNRELRLDLNWRSWLFGAAQETAPHDGELAVHLGPLCLRYWWERR